MSLEGFPVVVQLPVLWGDQDLFGHVNNTIHLKWIESSRVAYWERGSMRDYMTPHDLGPILASVTCDYKLQIRYPDQIEVGARAAKVGRTSITMDHQIYSANHDAIAATGKSVIVLFNYASQRPQRIPDDLRAIIEQCERQADT